MSVLKSATDALVGSSTNAAELSGDKFVSNFSVDFAVVSRVPTYYKKKIELERENCPKTSESELESNAETESIGSMRSRCHVNDLRQILQEGCGVNKTN